VKQQRLHARLEKWSKLTPEQRERARAKYRAFKKLPPAQREAVKKRILEQQAASAASAASGIPATPP